MTTAYRPYNDNIPDFYSKWFSVADLRGANAPLPLAASNAYIFARVHENMIIQQWHAATTTIPY